MNLEQLNQELDAPFLLSKEQLDSYNNNGYIKLAHVLSP